MPQDRLARKALRELKGHLELQASQERPVLRAQLGRKESKAALESLASRVPLDQLVLKALKAFKVLQVSPV